ncbi:MAG: AIM24 family protein [Anaeromassilibacillus sp.]
MAFVEIDGELVEYELAAGQQLVVDTGNVAGFEISVSIDIQQSRPENRLGGEGFLIRY